VVVVLERARAEQAAHDEARDPQRVLAGSSFAARTVTTNAAATPSSHHGASRNAIRRVVEVDRRVGRGEAAGDEHGQERPHAAARRGPIAVRMSNANVKSVPSS
jgi:hypothetical protein